MRARVLALCLLAGVVGGVGGCFEPADGGSCHNDSDCSDAVCSNVGECASQTYRLRVSWTVRGAQANAPGACDGVSELELVVSDTASGQEFSVSPVPCAIGTFLFDKMPPAYGTVAVNAYGPGGIFLTTAGGTADPAQGTIAIDLEP
ncbi:MAG TPA: hypothetical protein VHE35_00545 [Kofleriaceae bacterium]|nr:hypothetical protein [Kofleriaceae bacterium]